jgi:FMN phosphatase YigB (HAD superfamily)
MIKAVLLDLDNTLLYNPNEVFIKAYLSVFDDSFGHFCPPGRPPLSATLIDCVRDMNKRQFRRLYETNLRFVLTRLIEETGQTEAVIMETLEIFLTGSYLVTRNGTQPVKAAPPLVESLHALDYAVVIATNPIYPAEAIRQRLLWANLSDDFDDYAFVTHAGNMHFSKPNPAYYGEILGRIGVEPDEAIMIGDSIVNDVRPASQIGMHTCHIDFRSLHRFADSVDQLENLGALPHQPEMIIPQLEGNMGALFGMIDGINPRYWNQHPDPEEWSPLQILCHLEENEDLTQRSRLERILAEDDPFIVDPGPPLGPRDAVPCDTDGARVAHRFLQTRLKTLELIAGISGDQWNRRARHSIFGPTTLLEMAQFTAQHDRLHLSQLCRTIGNCE